MIKTLLDLAGTLPTVRTIRLVRASYYLPLVFVGLVMAEI